MQERTSLAGMFKKGDQEQTVLRDAGRGVLRMRISFPNLKFATSARQITHELRKQSPLNTLIFQFWK